MKIYLCDKIASSFYHVGHRLYRDLATLYYLQGIDTTSNIESRFDYAHFVDISQRKEIIYCKDRLKKKVVIDYFVDKKKIKNVDLKDIVIPLDDRRILNKCDLVIVCCQADKMVLISNNIKTPIEIMSLPVSEERFSNISNLEKNAFIQYAGLVKNEDFAISMTTYKDSQDIQDLIELANRFKNMKFFVFGPRRGFFTTPAKIKRLVKHSPDNIVFKSYTSEDIFKSAMLLSKFFIATRNSNVELLTVLEAMITKTQIFTFNTHYIGDVLVDNDNCLVAEDVEDMYELILNYSEETSTIDRAYEYAKTCSYDTTSVMLKKILSNYVELNETQE